MRITQKVRKILSNYEADSIGVKQNLARILMHGKLGGTGKMMILAVDQGFEHGPRAFAMTPAAYDPHYHYQFAIDGGMNAFAAPLGLLETGADTFLGAVPTILKINSGNSLFGNDNAPDQAVTASIDDALRLGCSAIGFTIYPGSDMSYEQIEELRELAAEAKACGLAVIVWSYARGALSKDGETAADIIAYGAHMACELGAHIVKVKLPTAHLEMKSAKSLYEKYVDVSTLSARVKHVVDACFNGRRMVIFSGGESKDVTSVLEDAQAIVAGGGFGSIIGRNFFQRPKAEALSMAHEVVEIFRQKR
ncbi:class I fructose-bisphosphate aldolase [Candidatus Odyssella acanthamoebae]|uniref:fructose-bisphosphate aldolase n=1 Tax=Candidatus Odyssella acanthamoebae TaxID=91604 RepID=A0A077AVU2_9PROT|nr:class I fructose-bisphosphate aldolase [Candidatus Paracaedibacter acanthamoebae]AIK96164.1 fructose-bisphosphate aldolase [Candidatus Paracaedibacter acanthamoebae]